jgi:cytoskeletal protein RodZ
MDEELVETDVPSVGEKLRAAREERGLSLEDIAAQTRIPRRHLENIEAADWDNLPAPTYTLGFARSYASSVGLDRTEIADQLRAEMGGQRMTTTSEVFEPADPARTMPKSLVLGAIVAVILLVILMSWLSRRSLETTDEGTANAPAATTPATTPQTTAPPPAAAAQGPVVLTATDAVWLAVKDNGHVLKQGIMQAGETYEVPATATAPVLTTAKSEALRINVGTAVAPSIGPAATKVTVSLLPADLMKAGQAAGPAPAATPAPPATAPRTRPVQQRPRATAPAPAASAPAQPQTEPAPTTNGAG